MLREISGMIHLMPMIRIVHRTLYVLQEMDRLSAIGHAYYAKGTAFISKAR